jgi:hypothetical protein
VDPLDVLADGDGATAGGVVLLGQVLLEHTLAEFGVVPGDFFAFGPGFEVHVAVDDVGQVHCVLLSVSLLVLRIYPKNKKTINAHLPWRAVPGKSQRFKAAKKRKKNKNFVALRLCVKEFSDKF